MEIDIVSTIDEVKYNKTQKSNLSYTFKLLQVVQKNSTEVQNQNNNYWIKAN